MSANNQNLAALSKRDSTLNGDGKSMEDDSYGGERDEGSISEDEDEEEDKGMDEESYSRNRPNTRNR